MTLWAALLLSSLADLRAAAFRTDVATPDTSAQGGHACPEAEGFSTSRHRFQLDAKDLHNFTLWQDWILKASEKCEGPDLGTASLLPVVNAASPEASKVSVVINENGDAEVRAASGENSRLFVCSRAGECAASLGFRAKEEARISDLLCLVVNPDIWKGIRNLPHSMRLLLDALLLVALACVVGMVVWFALLLRDSLTGGWELTSEEQVSDPNLRLPSSMDILLQGAIDVLFFVLGCALFVVEGERFFRRQDRTGEDPDLSGFVFVLVFPLLFGSVAVMRIFLATARCQLYYAALRDGILLKFKHKPSYFEPALLWVWLGVAICIGKAFQIMLMGSLHFGQGLKALLVMMSPLYYMTSSILDILHTEFAVCNQHCTVALQVVSDAEPIQIGANMVCMSDGAFCSVARQRADISRQRSIEEGDDSASDGFRVLDLAWLGRLLGRRATGAKKLLLLLFDPLQALTFLCLAVLTCYMGLRILLHQPMLADLQVIGGSLSSPFARHVNDYNILVDRMQSMISVSAQANPKDVTELAMHDSSEPGVQSQWTWGSSIAKAVTLDKEHYPYNIKIDAWDTTAHNSYSVQILKSGFLPESVTITGRTDDGRLFHRCIPWGYLWQRPWINVPLEVETVDMSISMAHYVMGIPENHRTGRFTTHFMPNMTKQECEKQQLSQPFSAVAHHTVAGCYAVYQPLWSSCGKAGQDEARHFLHLRSAKLIAELCSEKEQVCHSVKRSGPVLSFRNLSTGDSLDDAAGYEVKLSVNVGRTTLPIVDATNFYRVTDMRFLPGGAHAFTMLSFHLMSDNVSATPLLYGHEAERWTATILDNPAFKTQKTMQLTVVSADTDCAVESMQVRSRMDGTVPLKALELDKRVCARAMWAQGCSNNSGFLPARTFEIDLAYWRDLIVMQGIYSSAQWIHLEGRKRCDSFKGFAAHQEEVHLDFQHVTKVDDLDLVVHVADGSFTTTDVHCHNTQQHVQHCSVHAVRPGFVIDTGDSVSRVNLTMIFNQPNCSVEWKKSWDPAFPHQTLSDTLPVVPLDRSACKLARLAGAHECRGSRPSTTTTLDLAKESYHVISGSVSITNVQGYLHCNTFVNAMIEVSISISN